VTRQHSPKKHKSPVILFAARRIFRIPSHFSIALGELHLCTVYGPCTLDSFSEAYRIKNKPFLGIIFEIAQSMAYLDSYAGDPNDSCNMLIYNLWCLFEAIFNEFI
jgi:hypothetical protein